MKKCGNGHETWFLEDLGVVARCGFCGEVVNEEEV